MRVEHLSPSRQRAVRIMLQTRDPACRWRGKIPVPEHAHPLVRQLIGIMNEQRTTQHELGARAGISWQTIADWRVRRTPNLVTFIAAANALGYDLVLTPRGRKGGSE